MPAVSISGIITPSYAIGGTVHAMVGAALATIDTLDADRATRITACDGAIVRHRVREGAVPAPMTAGLDGLGTAIGGIRRAAPVRPRRRRKGSCSSRALAPPHELHQSGTRRRSARSRRSFPMQAVLNAALPIFALILAGFLSGRTALFGPAAADSLNRFAIYLALPALMFGAMAKITPDQVAQVGFAAAFSGGIAAAFVVAYLLGLGRSLRSAQACIEGLDAGYSNVGFMGIPLCLLVFGPASLPAAVIATLFTACVLFLSAIVLIELDLQKGAGWGTARKVVLALLRNPLLLAPLAGLAVGLTGSSVPGPVERFTALLGGAASPCALVCIGLFLAQERVGFADVRPMAVLVVLKLVLQPAVTALLVYKVFAVPDLWARAAVLLSALPIGSGPFTLAKLYGLEAGVTSGAILLSHIASVVTVSLLVAWLA